MANANHDHESPASGEVDTMTDIENLDLLEGINTSSGDKQQDFHSCGFIACQIQSFFASQFLAAVKSWRESDKTTKSSFDNVRAKAHERRVTRSFCKRRHNAALKALAIRVVAMCELHPELLNFLRSRFGGPIDVVNGRIYRSSSSNPSLHTLRGREGGPADEVTLFHDVVITLVSIVLPLHALLAASPPCQPWSTANKAGALGPKDDRAIFTKGGIISYQVNALRLLRQSR
jgi:hypothetical protein